MEQFGSGEGPSRAERTPRQRSPSQGNKKGPEVSLRPSVPVSRACENPRKRYGSGSLDGVVDTTGADSSREIVRSTWPP